MLKTSLIIFSLCVITIVYDSHAQSTQALLRETIITDPSISKTCEVLITNRKNKIKHRQRLSALAQRNQKLQVMTPDEKESIRTKLVQNLQSIKKEIILTNLKVRHVEEDIIRRGCPGIKL